MLDVSSIQQEEKKVSGFDVDTRRREKEHGQSPPDEPKRLRNSTIFKMLN